MLTINTLYTLILTIIDAFLFLFLLKSFVPQNNNTKKLHLILITGLTLLVLSLTLFNINPYVKVILVSFALLLYTYVYPITFQMRLFIILLFYFLVIFVESILTLLLFNLLGVKFLPTIIPAKDTFFIGLISKLLILGCITIILRFMKPNQIKLPRKHHFFLLIVLLFCIASIIMLFSLSLRLEGNSVNDALLFTISIALVGINFGVFYFYTNLNKYYKNAQKYEVKKALDKIHEKQLSKSQMENEMTSKIYHDIKNHLKTLEYMMEEKSDKDSQNYLSSLKKKVERIPKRIKTGNKIADIVLNEKSVEAAAYKIDFHVKAAVPPVLEMEDVDFSSILFNTIDNAIEAVINLPKEETGIINIDLYPKAGNLYYRICNNYSDRETEKELFSKKEGLSPGYGLKIVQDIISKYKGHLHYEKNNGEFILRIHIPILENDFSL